MIPTTRKEALSSGAVRYFTGKPCKNGHIDERTAVKGMCCQCQRETAAMRWRFGLSWLQQDKSRATEAVRKWTANHVAKKAKKNQDWRTSNRSEVNAHAAKRRAAKLQRTPLWADKEQIGMWYSVAEVLSRGGVEFHVDHIVPLQGREVCGFHSHDNLQVLPWFENLHKSAKLKEKNNG